MTDALLHRNSCGWYVGMIIDYVLMKTLPVLKKGYKNWGPKFQAFLSLQ